MANCNKQKCLLNIAERSKVKSHWFKRARLRKGSGIQQITRFEKALILASARYSIPHRSRTKPRLRPYLSTWFSELFVAPKTLTWDLHEWSEFHSWLNPHLDVMVLWTLMAWTHHRQLFPENGTSNIVPPEIIIRKRQAKIRPKQ